MDSPSSHLRVTRLALMHAVLAYISPEFTETSRLPLPLPTEIRLRILTYLHLTLAASLLESLHNSLHNALHDLCLNCRAYNFHVYGENVSEWPQIKATGGCWCAQIGAHLRPGITRHNRWNSEARVDLKFRLPIPDSDPPPYFTFHLRHIAVTYLATTLASPYTRELEALITPRVGALEIDALVFRVLQDFHCRLSPSKSGTWNLGDVLCIMPVPEHPSDEVICTLQLALELDIHRGCVSGSKLHPRNVRFTPSLIVHPSDSTPLLSIPTSRIIQVVSLACMLFGIRYLAAAPGPL